MIEHLIKKICNKKAAVAGVGYTWSLEIIKETVVFMQGVMQETTGSASKVMQFSRQVIQRPPQGYL